MTQQASKKRIAIFGSTGSIGTQALDVIRANPSMFEVEILTAQTNDELLITQAMEFRPNAVVIGDRAVGARIRQPGGELPPGRSRGHDQRTERRGAVAAMGG